MPPLSEQEFHAAEPPASPTFKTDTNLKELPSSRSRNSLRPAKTLADMKTSQGSSHVSLSTRSLLTSHNTASKSHFSSCRSLSSANLRSAPEEKRFLSARGRGGGGQELQKITEQQNECTPDKYSSVKRLGGTGHGVVVSNYTRVLAKHKKELYKSKRASPLKSARSERPSRSRSAKRRAGKKPGSTVVKFQSDNAIDSSIVSCVAAYSSYNTMDNPKVKKVIKIQSVFRGYRVRKVQRWLRYIIFCATTIQRGWRRRLARREKRKKTSAATVI